MSFTSKYAMLKGKEGKELAKVRARARRGRTTARRLTLCPRARRSPVPRPCAQSHTFAELLRITGAKNEKALEARIVCLCRAALLASSYPWCIVHRSRCSRTRSQR